jgi:putative endonuclease
MDHAGGNSSRFYAYVLQNDTAGRRYIGQTDDLAHRLAEHNAIDGHGRRYTAKFAGSWRLIYQEEASSRSEAMRREKWLKSGVGRAWFDETFSRASPPKAD